MTRPRDRQRDRVMYAEDEVTRKVHWLTREAIDGHGTVQGIVPRIIESRWWQDQLERVEDTPLRLRKEHMEVIWLKRKCQPFSRHTTQTRPDRNLGTVVDNHVHRRIRLDMSLPEWSVGLHRSQETPITHVYHALAHFLHGPDTEMHGPEFAGAYLKIMDEFSADAATSLRHQYGVYGVEFLSPVTVWTSEAAREKAIREIVDIRDDLATEIEKGEWS